MASDSVKPNRLFFFTKHPGPLAQLHQILHHYGEIPENPADKGQLYRKFASVMSEISEDEAESIEFWLENGGSLPHPQKRRLPRSDDASRHLKRSTSVYVEPESDDDEHAYKKKCIRSDVLDVDAWVPTRTVDSIVCLEALPRSAFLHSNTTKACKHENDVCYECMKKNVSIYIEDGAQGQLECPSCPEALSFDNIRVFTSEEEFARFDDLVAKSAMRQMEDLKMCLGPNCGNGMLYTHQEITANPQLVCRECSFRTCVTHQVKWHDGQTCEEYDRMKAYSVDQLEQFEKDNATANLLAGSSGICPKCGNGVTMNGGCDHMTCRCGAEWNYQAARAQPGRIIELIRGGPIDNGIQEAAQLWEAERKRRIVLPDALQSPSAI